MAITNILSSYETSGWTGSEWSLTQSVTVGASADYVVIAIRSGGAPNSATFNSASVTPTVSASDSNAWWVGIYVIASPGAGTYDFQTLTGGNNFDYVIVTGDVEGSSGIADSDAAGGYAVGGRSLTLTTAADDMLMDIIATYETATASAGQTTEYAWANNGAVSTKTATGASTEMSWTHADAFSAQAAVAFTSSSSNTLTITEDSIQYGEPITLTTSITDGNAASGSDGTTTLSLTGFTGSDGSFTASAPAIPVGSAGWAPGSTVTITITNGTDTATDTVTLAAPDGFNTVTATTQASGLEYGDWGYVGEDGLDAAVTAGDILWTTYSGDNADGTSDEPASLPLTPTRYIWDDSTSIYSLYTLTYPGESGLFKPKPFGISLGMKIGI